MNKIILSLKMQMRVPISIFFTVFFPLIMMFVMMTSFKNFDIGQGYHFIDKYVLVTTGIGLIPLTLISFPIWVGESIRNDSYKRLKYFNVNLLTYTLADVFSYVVLALLSIFVNISVAYFVYGAKLPSFGYLAAYVLQCLYGVFAFLLVGTLIALVVKNTRVLLPLGMTLLFACYMFTGAFVQFDKLPSSIQKIGSALPWKYMMNDFFEIWGMNEYWNLSFLKVTSLWLVASGVVLLGVVYLRKTLERKRVNAS